MFSEQEGFLLSVIDLYSVNNATLGNIAVLCMS